MSEYLLPATDEEIEKCRKARFLLPPPGEAVAGSLILRIDELKADLKAEREKSAALEKENAAYVSEADCPAFWRNRAQAITPLICAIQEAVMALEGYDTGKYGEQGDFYPYPMREAVKKLKKAANIT